MSFPFLAEGETNQTFGNVIGDEKFQALALDISLDIEESLYNFYNKSVVVVLMNFRHWFTIEELTSLCGSLTDFVHGWSNATARNIFLRLDDCLLCYGLSVGVTVGLISIYILSFLF